MMTAAGFNALRVYTVPPRWLLDLAREHGQVILVGIPWEQHVTLLDDPQRQAAIETRVREGVRSVARHPALLGVTIGNEIPASIVRWHRRKSVERLLQRLYQAAKAEDPGALVTYVNFPTTDVLSSTFSISSASTYIPRRRSGWKPIWRVCTTWPATGRW
jgi:beta-galactosidase/beta-glucuronidase